MSLRRKRKASAPARLASPFVGDQYIGYDDLGLSTSTARNFFSRKASYALDKRSNAIAEEGDSGVTINVDSIDGVSSHGSLGGSSIWFPDEDEGYNSPNLSVAVPSPATYVLPENPGELALHFLMCSFVAESEKKIDAFMRSVSMSP